jgi:serine phosphatase RsbU (regulator of sigma subunit)
MIQLFYDHRLQLLGGYTRMFSLRDFFHLPQLDGWVEQLAQGGPGLTVVAGLDSRAGRLTSAAQPAAGEILPSAGLLPSGRSAFFSILIDQVLTSQPEVRCLIIARDQDAVRIPRQFRRRMRVLTVEPPFSYAGRVEAALEKPPGLLVLDRLDSETVNLALSAAWGGLFVLAPLDTVFYGSEAARHLLSLGAAAERLAALRWVFSVQRLSTLCPQCKRAVMPDEAQVTRLQALASLYSAQDGLQDLASAFSDPGTLSVYQPVGCLHCRNTGRLGDLSVFDVFLNPPQNEPSTQVLAQRSVLPLQAYVARLALLGHLSLEDFLDFEVEQFRRVAHSLLDREALLVETTAADESRLAQLEAANRVLEQRTRSLVSLQEFGQALLASLDLKELARRISHFAIDLCGADRVIVYSLPSDREAETLAVGGWATERVPLHADPSPLLATWDMDASDASSEPAAYNHWPPGIPPRHPDVEGAQLRAGLLVPLVVQQQRVGLILAHTTRKPSFSPKEISLLTTLAQQAALGIQRARLVGDLRDKIDQLEQAQAELASKERLERELELARQVQQSMLPRRFPHISGFHFAARNTPARQVGGDFYDVIPLDADHFGVAIADVSDKGLPAALYMALTRSLLRAEAPRQSSPDAVLRDVNQLLLELGDGSTFVTLFYGMIDRRTGRMLYSRAGHDRPLLLRKGEAQSLSGDGTPLGILNDDFRLSQEEVQLLSNDRLVLYTDGLTDVVASDGALFGLERLEALLKASASLSLDRMGDALFEHLLAYQAGAEQYDDMTLLVMEVE